MRVYYSYGNHFIDDPRHFHSKDDRFGVLAYQNIQPWHSAAMTVGFDFDTYSGAIPVSGGRDHYDGSMSTIDRKRITEYSPYLTLSQKLAGELLTLNGGVRMANSDMVRHPLGTAGRPLGQSVRRAHRQGIYGVGLPQPVVSRTLPLPHGQPRPQAGTLDQL